MAGKLDDFWLQLRVVNIDIPAADKLTVQQPLKHSKSYAPTLSDALDIYCRLNGGRKSEFFFTAVHRSHGYVIERLGNRSLDSYINSDVAKFKDRFLSVLVARQA